MRTAKRWGGGKAGLELEMAELVVGAGDVVEGGVDVAGGEEPGKAALEEVGDEEGVKGEAEVLGDEGLGVRGNEEGGDGEVNGGEVGDGRAEMEVAGVEDPVNVGAEEEAVVASEGVVDVNDVGAEVIGSDDGIAGSGGNGVVAIEVNSQGRIL